MSAASAPTGSSAPIVCSVPGCGGTIVDGYCERCGSPPAAVPAARSAPAAAAASAPASAAASAPAASAPAPASASAPASDRCGQPGCSGTIVDGYCESCGSPPSQTSGSSGTSGGTSSGSSGYMSGSTSTGGTYRTGSTRTGSSRSSRGRGRLGEGLVEVPPVPYRDPSTAVMSDPQVAENKRFCSSCGEPVGRSRGDRPGRTEGFCAKCRAAFSFRPKLSPGDLVHGQYDVLGCLAHGGLGWIYLAKDKNVSDRWVVLKGLLDSGDADAIEAAAAERAFLAEVEHPNIVRIYNFVQHAGDGYIVMEYVGGQSLKDILLHRRRELGEESLPVTQAIAYALEVLRAFDYLHTQGLVYCDFKPDNVIQSEEQLRLIDLGGVRRLTRQDGAIYGTIGYQAPEIADEGPSITSDLYTVGRALAVLSFPFKGYTRKYVDSLPARGEVELLRRYESFDRFLRRATHRDPAERFQDAGEMAEQLTGVLREILATEDGEPRPEPSGLFGPERFAAGDTLVKGGRAAPGDPSEPDALDGPEPALPPVPPARAAAALPVPLVVREDPMAGFLRGLTALEPAQLAAAVAGAPQHTPEVRFALARAKIEMGLFDEAEEFLEELGQELPGDWRIEWYRAVSVLAQGRVAEAEPRFDRLYGLLPGEAAPKLALAYCRERGAPADAVRLYELVWRTDQSYINAAFGLARVHLAAGDRGGAIAALDSVPKISIRYVPAQVAAVATAVRGRHADELTAAELVEAGERLGRLGLDGEHGDRLAAEVLEAALDWLVVGPGPGAGARGGALLGEQLAEAPLRSLLERTYRGLARLTRDREESRLLIDAANTVRPRTLL
ncbi:protein kinase [Actinomadura sp. NEAU-AAG7]|nr:serine/threonine-protein kinase [Actinomadura sp. NEAU-AAG7]MBT2213740.1 protein kinase [Actinomadura sp. NEAU-AAG7]